MAVAPEPPPPVNLTVGAEVYRDPVLVTVTEATVSGPAAVPVAVAPPAGAEPNVTVGTEV